MLIDNATDSSTIRNVSYLIPIGICIYTIVSAVRNILYLWSYELGIYMQLDEYVNYWFSHSASLILVSVTGFLFVRSMWKRVISGQFNCARLFISLLILSVVFIGISFFNSRIIHVIEEARNGESVMHSNEFVDFRISLGPYVWAGEYLIQILALTFAMRGSRKQLPSNDY